MEQKEILHKYYIAGTATLDKVLRALTHLSTDGLEKMKDGIFPLAGETNLYKLMNRSDPLTSVFLNEKVDFLKLKSMLADQGLPFAFKQTNNGVSLFFRVKDKELAKNALKRVLDGIKTDPKKVLRTPGTMTFEEKLAYAKNNLKYKGALNKTIIPQKGRGL